MTSRLKLAISLLVSCTTPMVFAGIVATGEETHWFNLVSAKSGRCLDVVGGPSGIADGQNVQQWTCDEDATNQMWRREAVDSTHWHVIARHSGKCLDVEGGSGAVGEGANIDQWRCGGASDTNQLWQLKRVKGLSYQLIAKHSGKCVTVQGASTSEGANIIQSTCGGRDATHQLWRPRLAATTGGGPSGTAHSNGQGFDACTAPSVSTMQTWGQSSPYDFLGIYIGGSLRACSQPNLTASWITSTAAQGWGYLPTWVGPQAPCSSFSKRISYDVATAYQEGLTEARAAAAAAATLGLDESIVYYDMEYHAETDACVAATKSFISGWVDQMRAEGFVAGVYGSPCNLDNYLAASAPPDAIWGANWIYSGYTAGASPYGMSCLSDSAWSDARIRQYAGDHDETWGGVRINIDSNTADGPVAVETAGRELVDVGLTERSNWWLLFDNGELWMSPDAGERYRDASLHTARLVAVDFVDAANGWAVDASLSVHRTTDGGGTWVAVGSLTDLPDAPLGGISVDALPGLVAITLQEARGINFSQGWLYTSQNGGATWTRGALPLGEPVAFVDETAGWLAGGPTGDRLFTTRDGGVSWQEASLALPEEVRLARVGRPQADATGGLVLPVVMERAGTASAHLYRAVDGEPADMRPTVQLDRVVFADAKHGLGFVGEGICDEAQACRIVQRLMWTKDGGATWTEARVPGSAVQ